MKTIHYYIKRLKTPYNLQAFNNTKTKDLNKEVENISQALINAFVFSETPQGNRY